jgi:hypothetical protein
MDKFKIGEVFTASDSARDVSFNKIGGLKIQVLSAYDEDTLLVSIIATGSIIRIYGTIENDNEVNYIICCEDCGNVESKLYSYNIKKRFLGIVYSKREKLLCMDCLVSNKYK